MARFLLPILLLLFPTVAWSHQPVTVTGFSSSESWTVPFPVEIRNELAHWLQAEEIVDPLRREELLALWTEPEGTKNAGRVLFDRTVESMRRACPPIATYLSECDRLAWQELPFGKELILPRIPIQLYLSQSGSTRFLQGTLRHYLALRLIQARLYDEAAPILDELNSKNTVDPIGLLIGRAIVAYQLGDQEKGRKALDEFQNSVRHDTGIPRRHAELAKLLRFDLEQAQKNDRQDESDKIGRKMNNIRRRLGKGRTDEETQKAEKEAMESLEQLIEKIQQQANKAAQSGQGGQGNSPADDSRILQQKGPGNVDRKQFDPNGDWGEMPPKEREEALLKIEKEFPAHYRDMIEQYFREMAVGESSNP